MYFLKDNSREDGVIYFINPKFSLAQAYKVLLPCKVQFLDSQNIKNFSLIGQKRDGSSYFVFRKKNQIFVERMRLSGMKVDAVFIK